jgi:heme exporter protein A
MTYVSDSLEWRSLSLWRGDRMLQQELAGSLDAGQALTLRGPNGCGKTTLIRTLCGLSEAETGQVLWGGKSILTQRSEFNAALAYSGHALGLKADLSPRENLAFAQGLRGGTASDSDLLAQLGLARCCDLPVQQLSAGQKQRAALATVLGSGAAVWVLDEPFTHIDDAGRHWLATQFNQHLAAGGRLLLAAHQETGIHAQYETVVQLTGGAA